MTRAQIPFLDVSAEIDEIRDEIAMAIQDVLRSARFILGSNVTALEREFAEYLGVRHAIGVNSGTDALILALHGMRIGPGDEVVTSPFTFLATAEAIRRVGATPVFVDIDRRTFNLSPELIPPAITQRTKAILPVHLFGQAAEMEAIQAIADQYGLQILEDVAQACGGRYRGRKLGAFGTAAAFSFFPTKTLSALGDGGMLVTENDQIADTARMLRVHGSRQKHHGEAVGYNSRLDEIQAAVLRVKLPRLDGWNAARRRCAAHFSAAFKDLPGVSVPAPSDTIEHVYHQYTLRMPAGIRDDVRRQLDTRGISTMVYYPVPLHTLPIYGRVEAMHLPEAETAAREVLSLPIWPNLETATQSQVIDAVRSAVIAATDGSSSNTAPLESTDAEA
jgi:dTDP-4-amino-4,6-dideoxygalactose transaminase